MTRIDVRGLPVWERPALVFEAFDRLLAGQTLTVITENEPRGLSAQFLQERKPDIIVEPRRIGAQEWHLTLTRTPQNGHVTGVEHLLARVRPFIGLPADVRARLASAATVKTTRRTETVATPSSDWPYLGIVAEGALAMTSGDDASRERIFYEISPGEVFGETQFFDQGRSLGEVITLSKTARHYRIPIDVVQSVAAAHPQVLLGLGDVLAQRLRNIAEALTAQATLPILSRIAAALLPYALPDRGLQPSLAPLPSMTQAQIAAAAGTVKEVAARAIAELEARECLKRERGHIRYLDRQKLVDLSRDRS